jgi:hypothetical protein
VLRRMRLRSFNGTQSGTSTRIRGERLAKFLVGVIKPPGTPPPAACVRSVLCCSAFPSVPGLCSTGSDAKGSTDRASARGMAIGPRARLQQALFHCGTVESD